MIKTGGAAGEADDAELGGHFGLEHAGVLKTVARAGVGADEFDQFAKFLFKAVHQRADGEKLTGVEIKTDAARAGHAAQEAVAGEVLVEAQHAFLEAHGVHVGGDEGDVGANGADVGDVIVKALQFQAKGAKGARARRGVGVGGAFQGVAEGDGMGETGIAGNAFGQPHSMRNGQRLE